jgi:hypothetical protein
MSAALLRSKVNPNNTTHHLTLVEAGEIMSVTDDHQILHAMAAEQGYTLQLIGAVPGGDLMRTLLHANAVEGDFDRILHWRWKTTSSQRTNLAPSMPPAPNRTRRR